MHLATDRYLCRSISNGPGRPHISSGTSNLDHIRDHSVQLGALAQLGERLICIQEVSGSIPLGSTRIWAQQPHGPALTVDFALQSNSPGDAFCLWQKRLGR